MNFNKLVDSCTLLLKTKRVHEITDSGHIDLMLCFNTIHFSNTFDPEKRRFEKKFSGDRYDLLEKVIEDVDYLREIIKVYPEWIPNRGMGYFFPKLKMELAGTPRRYAVINVIVK